MAVTLKQTEGIPSAWPAVPAGLSAAAAALPSAVIWQRLEGWIAHRWAPRSVVWIVEGPGDWSAPLSPASIATVEAWGGAGWAEAFPAASPFGGYGLATGGPYRFTGTAGAGPVPAAGNEAYRRLAEYMGDAGEPSMWKGRAGATSTNVDLGSVKQSFDRSATWLAKALHNSGAADLLRPYRSAA
jgi:hypothetical protein